MSQPGKASLSSVAPDFAGPGQQLRRHRRGGLGDDLAGPGIDDVLGHHRVDQRLRAHLDLGVAAVLERLAQARVELQTGKQIRGGDAPTHLRGRAFVLDREDSVVEGQGDTVGTDLRREEVEEDLEELGVGLEPKGPQEDRPGEPPFAVDPHVQDLLLVELELDPRPAVRHHLGEQRRRRLARERDARGAVQLRDDHPLGAVDDERPRLGHERELTEVEFLLLDVPHLFLAPAALLEQRRGGTSP